MQKRKLGVQEPKQLKKNLRLWKWAIALLCIIGVFLLVKPYAEYLKGLVSSTGKNVIKVVSQTVGTEMKKDQFWNVNAALIGYGGGQHGGGYLADTIIIASRNPTNGAVSMLSIPRDLYIKNPLGGAARINAVFSQIFGHHKKDLHAAASGFLPTLEKITGLSIPYYATIDFSGFKTVIDTLWGIDIEVPYALHDYQYPDENLRGYDPLHIEAGWQHMDGALALKYSRSRHAAGHASDFDRSFRQQLVIDAIKNKLLSSENLSLERVQQLYENFTQMVTTNVSLDEMLWTVQFLDMIKMFTFGLNNHYNPTNYKAMHKWAFLYNPSREQFGWASVMIPFGASAGNLDHYDQIHEYVDFITHMQNAFLQGGKIDILNAISKEQLRAKGLQNAKLANKLAAKMKRYGLELREISNTEPQSLTQVRVYTERDVSEWFDGLITAIQNFLPIDEIVYATGVVKNIIDDYGNEINIFTGAEVEIVLWENYLSGSQALSFPERLQIQYR